MVLNLLNVILAPFYATFSSLDIENNFVQAGVAILLVISIINAAVHFIIYK